MTIVDMGDELVRAIREKSETLPVLTMDALDGVLFEASKK